MLLATQHVATDSDSLPPRYRIEHSGDYGPGGIGPSFILSIDATGGARLSSQRWRLPDGVYSGYLDPDDFLTLRLLLTEVLVTDTYPSGRFLCPHSPVFTATDLALHCSRSACVETLRRDRLDEINQFVLRAVCRAHWSRVQLVVTTPNVWLYESPATPPCE